MGMRGMRGNTAAAAGGGLGLEERGLGWGGMRGMRGR